MLRPCTACTRHVRAEEAVCPFCAATIEAAPSAATNLGLRLPRAARAALGAAAVVAIAGCGGSSTQTQDASGSGAGAGATSSASATAADTSKPPPDDINMAKPYGAPPPPPMV